MYTCRTREIAKLKKKRKEEEKDEEHEVPPTYGPCASGLGAMLMQQQPHWHEHQLSH